jgi:hypothetical protein
VTAVRPASVSRSPLSRVVAWVSRLLLSSWSTRPVSRVVTWSVAPSWSKSVEQVGDGGEAGVSVEEVR